MKPQHIRHSGAIALSTLWDADRTRAKAQIVSVRERAMSKQPTTKRTSLRRNSGPRQSMPLEKPLSLFGDNNPKRRARNINARNNLFWERCRFDIRESLAVYCKRDRAVIDRRTRSKT